jgi:flagellar basal-body rod modification protein FlgD
MSIIPPTGSTSGTGTPTVSGAVDNTMIASNFTSFLQLLTTQLKNQNPLDPLDTNQFTQQLVQFAQVEQQMNTNTSLGTLISLQQTSQTSAALGFLGSTVTVDGNTAKLANSQATWHFSGSGPATATVTITSATGQTAYSGTFAVAAGAQDFVWAGKGNDGTPWADGDYTVSIAAKDANGQSVAVSTEVAGVVDGVDLSQNPPILSIGSETFPLDKVKQVRRAGI